MIRKLMILILGVALLGGVLVDKSSAATGFSLSVGSDDFYLSVGNYDYFSYALPYYNRTPRISFHSVMGDYGTWVYVSPFGQVWRPYVRAGWRPYVNGHWIYTRYGPTWVGYEPWGWAGYHYGNWIWTSRYGWVWIPGYDWHPGRVIWSHGYDTIGWMPAPPHGYDYSGGYLSYRGSHGQFDYYDDDFGYYDDDYYYGAYDSRYSHPFYGTGYRNIVVNLWVFIDVNHYGHHNYADYYLDSDYTRALFDRRLVRISARPLQRPTLERIVKRKVHEVSVEEREIETNNRRVKVVVAKGEEENIRRNANRVVKKDIAPAFAEKRRDFKGIQSENAPVVNRVFKQENRKPKIQKKSADEVLREVQRETEQVERQRKNLVREKTEKVIRNNEAAKSRGKKGPQAEKEQKSKEPAGNRPAKTNRDDQFKVQPKSNAPGQRQLPSEVKPKEKEQKQGNRIEQSERKANPGNRKDEVERKQNQKEKDEQFERKQQMNRPAQRNVEPRSIPKQQDRIEKSQDGNGREEAIQKADPRGQEKKEEVKKEEDEKSKKKPAKGKEKKDEESKKKKKND